MNQREKAIFLIELVEAMLTKEMQKSSAIGPDKINNLLIELTKIRHSLDDKIMDIEPHKPMPNKIEWMPSEPIVQYSPDEFREGVHQWRTDTLPK